MTNATRRALLATARAVPPIRRLVQQRDIALRQVARLRRQNERLRRRQVEKLDDAEGLRFLFIVTYGRSGSTLLQGILSSIPGYLIRGENGGIAYDLYKFHTTAVECRDTKPGSKSPRSAWFGIGGYPEEQALREMRRLLLTTVIRPNRGSRVVGFKEIRWLQQDLHDYVDFLRAVFPGARFVINTRSLDDVSVSKWWAQNPESLETLSQAESRMLDLRERLGDDAFRTHYDDYVDRPGSLRDLFEWLGEEFDESSVAEVMSRQHSY